MGEGIPGEGHWPSNVLDPLPPIIPGTGKTRNIECGIKRLPHSVAWQEG